MEHQHTERIIGKLACHECGVTPAELELQAALTKAEEDRDRYKAALTKIGTTFSQVKDSEDGKGWVPVRTAQDGEKMNDLAMEALYPAAHVQSS